MICIVLSAVLTILLHGMLGYVTKYTELQIILNKGEHIGYSIAHFLCCFAVLRLSVAPAIAFCYMMILGPAVIIDLKYRTVFVYAFFFPAAMALFSCIIHIGIYKNSIDITQIGILAIGMALLVCTMIFKWQGVGDIYVAGACVLYFVKIAPDIAGFVFMLFLLIAYVLFIVVLFICKIKGYKKWTLPLVPFFYIAFVVNAILI